MIVKIQFNINVCPVFYINVCRGGPEVNTSPLVHEVASSNPGKYQCVFFNTYILSKFILDITDIGEGKYREETWTYNQYDSEIANPS